MPPPRHPPFAINREEQPVKELSTMSDVESYFFKRSVVDFEMASSLVDLQHDDHESRQIVERSDQKSLNSELEHQRQSQSRLELA